MKTFLPFLILAAVIAANESLSIGKIDKKVMVCYYGTWAVYRPGAGKFDVEDIDPYICTHVIYSFVGLAQDNTLKVLDPYNDLPDNYGKGAMPRFTGLKEINPELKTILAIGGWNEGSESYSKMAADPAERAKFINSALEFLLKYNFDGLDLDWEYPANRGGVPADKVNFISLISELKTAFGPHGLMLSAAVNAGKETIDTAYDVPAMSRILDHIHVMCYDYHGAWESFTGHNAPLYEIPGVDTNIWFNIEYTINYWISQGADPSKLILGMPLYGHGFVLSDQSQHGFYAPAPQPMPAGPYTREAGSLGYNEICEKFGEGDWTVVRDPFVQAPYAYKGNQWLGYDDQESLKVKAEFAVSKGLGGAMVWSMETDDFHGTCGTQFILIKTIYETLNGPTVFPTPPTSGPTSPRTTTQSNGETPAPDAVCETAGKFRDPNDCAKYYECVPNGDQWIVYYFSCGRGTVYDPATSTCNYPQYVPGCENYPTAL